MSKRVYMRVPTPAEFKKDSYVLFANRKKDYELTAIDELLATYHDPNIGYVSRFYVLLQLQALTKAWDKKKGQGNRRRAAIEALHATVEAEMRRTLGATKENYEEKLRHFLARGMTQHGHDVDGKTSNLRHIQPHDLWKYEVYVQGGKLWQYPWWDRKRRNSLHRGSPKELVETKYTNLLDARYGLVDGKYHAGYVMDLDHKLYMGWHSQSSAFHSQYTRGGPVLCAGTLRVHEGRLRCITNMSGHYQPGVQRLIHVVDWFHRKNVNLSEVYLCCVAFIYVNNQVTADGTVYYRAEELRTKRSFLQLTEIPEDDVPENARV